MPASTGTGARLGFVAAVVDARDPDALAAFWGRALGGTVGDVWTDARGTRFVQLDLAPGRPCLLFQTAPDPAGSGAVHLDVAPGPGGDQRAEVERLCADGATVVSDDADLPWAVLADPEGNRFCVLPPREPG